MKVLGLIATIALVVASEFVDAAPIAEPQPAVWVSHMLVIDLSNLPKRYSCDELWYKFKAVLMTLGARPDMKILPYRCERGAGSNAYSPKVQLQFSIPRAVSGENARWADLQVSSESIRLQPGSPGRIDRQDCNLLNQIRTTLLPDLGATVIGFNLACQASQSAHSPFGLTVKALIPVSQSLPDVASVVPGIRPSPR